MKFVEPQIFLIAETKIENEGLSDFLSHIGAPNWDTNAPSDSEKLTEVAGKTCYLSFSPDLNKNLTRVRENRNRDYIQEGLIKVNHGSVLEHSSVTFAITGVSRIFTHELVRHRAGCAYSQESGRYVRRDEIEAYQPNCLTEDELLYLNNALQSIEVMYQNLETKVFSRVGDDFGTKKKVTSAIRRMLPNGQGNTIIFTANHRALRHIINLRTNPYAEEEIIFVFNKIKAIVKERYPNIYEDIN